MRRFVSVVRFLIQFFVLNLSGVLPGWAGVVGGCVGFVVWWGGLVLAPGP